MIELFKEPNIDWMGKAKYFYALSAILLIAGWTNIFLKGGPVHGGLPYSIDFKGGMNVDVRFAQPPRKPTRIGRQYIPACLPKHRG